MKGVKIKKEMYLQMIQLLGYTIIKVMKKGKSLKHIVIIANLQGIINMFSYIPEMLTSDFYFLINIILYVTKG